MTDVETSSTTRSSRRERCISGGAGLVWAVVTLLACTLLPWARPAGADPLATARAQAAAVNAQLQADGVQLDIASQRYDAAEQQVAALTQRQAALQAQITSTQQQVASDQAALRAEAVQAYMTASSGTSLPALFSGSGEQASASQEYRSVADGTLGGDIDRLHRATTVLGDQRQQLAAEQQRAQQALVAARAAQQAAQAAQSAEQAVLRGLNSQIAALVAQQQQAQQAAQRAAFSAAVAQSAGARTTGAPVSLPAAGGAATAVAAAESQLGVPYQWGGESPGVGFDCSGLTQWAWRQAGVSLPRTAAAQYDAIPHIPLADLQPGDLVFWNDGTSSIQHVAMYVGNGEVVQAPYSGASVSYAPIWTSGLVGAGRP